MTRARERTAWLAPRAACTPRAEALRIGDERISFAGLAARAESAAAVLRARGVRAGDTLAVLLRGGLDVATWLHAADALGATLLPLHPRLTEPELVFQVGDAGARWLVHDARDEALRARASRILAATGAAEVLPGADALRSGPAGADEANPSGDAPLLLLYTSGTTGRPKAAELGSEALRASAVASAFHLGALPGDRWLAALPLAHVGGLSILLRACLTGASVILHDRFDAEAVDRAVEEEGVTALSLVAAMLERWLDARGARRAPPHLRSVLVGGGPTPEPLLARARALGIPVLPTYGLTEAASQVATRAPDDGARPLDGRLRPLLGTAVRVVDERGREAAPGAPGEILVRGPTLMRGYWGRPEATARALAGGWLHTGDVGRLDAEGRLEVLDRRDDLVVSGGENVYPAEVEAVLRTHPAVRDAAVVGEPDARFGRRPVAFVVARRAPVAEEALRAHCRTRLAAYKVPVAFRWVEALPRSSLGKLQRGALRPAAAQTAAGMGSFSGSAST